MLSRYRSTASGFTLLLTIGLFLMAMVPAQAQLFRQPSPGDVYREYAVAIDLSADAWHVTNAQAVVNYPGAAGPYPNPINQISIDAGALAGATRAEAVLTIWGGHVGTSGKQIAFNGNAFLNIPELQSTPTAGQNYMQQVNVTIDVPVNNLKEGVNTFQGESGPQTAYSFGWGQWGLYGVIIRVYYDPATKAHVTGTVSSPATNATIGDNPTVSASVSGSANRVDFVAYYDGFDSDGDGVYLEYHNDYHMPKFGAMAIQNHVGTSTASPWSVTWNNGVVPDQSGMRMVARIRGTDGVWYVTQPTTNITLARTNASVVLYKPFNVGEREWAKGDVDDGVHPAGYQVQDITIPSTANVVSATALIRTWHGADPEDPNYFIRFNTYTFPPLGDSYFAKQDAMNVPASALTTGTNSFTFYSEVTTHHGIEILWPGPALAVRFSGSGGGVAPSITANPSNQSVIVGQTATFTVGASGTAPLTYQWQKNATNIAGANAATYTTPATVIGDNGSTYRCVVTNSVNTATSTAATLTVTSAPPPSGIVSDDFHTGVLNTAVWTAINPRNDASFTFTGAGTADARLSIVVPSGTIHDCWTGGITAPRIMQTITNTDFEAEVKFDGSMTAGYQIQGIFVQQDATNFLRFDLVRDASAISFFAASFANDVPTVQANVAVTSTAPLYLRVKRVGNVWTGSYSTNGTTWTQGTSFTRAMTVSSIGPWAGNAGSPVPAFTALVDYFFNRASPISPEDPTGGGSTPPSITSQPANQSVTVGQTATFTVVASGTVPLSYQWQKNSSNINGANAATYTTPATVIGDNGSTYRCVVTNSVTSVTSNAATLTVTSAPPPGSLVSDDFHTGTLNTSLWTAINPRNDASFTLTGAGTVDARLSIVVPSGSIHDCWTGGITAPRIMQTVTNTDFEAEVKFDGAMTAGYQIQGILVQQDATNFLRFDLVRDASATSFFAASFANDVPTVQANVAVSATAPVYLRVKRVGNVWTGSYSTNGTTWTQGTSFTRAMTVSSIGPWAGNAGSPAPAFTALIDYFFNTASPLSPEDPTGGGNLPPSITSNPVNQTVTVGQTATFTVGASGTAPLTYQWQKNNANITGANAASYTTPATVIADNGSTYRCVVTNSVNTATSNAATLTVNTVTQPPAGWWNASWRYRVPVTVSAAGYARTDRPAEVTLNFTQLLTSLGTSGALNESSLRVIEVNGTGGVLDSTVVFQFDKDAAYNATSRAQGTIVFLLNGTTAAGATRTYHVYFETAGGFASPSFANRITVTDNVQDEGEACYLVSTQLASYYYQKQGAGFSSIVDLNGNDWLNYHVGGGSAGEYRGLPNLGPFGHPGYTNSTSTLVTNGPIKATVSSQTTDGLYALTWEFYPRFAKLTVTKAAGPFWLLYEGTPGGAYNPTRDFWVRSSGQRSTDDIQVVGDIAGPEWAYFGDDLSKRFLYLAHHEDDNLEDQYWNMENNMTVFGFGRQYATTTQLITQVPTHMTIGFGEDTLQAVTTIDGSFRDLGVNAGTPETSGGVTPPPPTGIVSDNFNAASLNTGLWTRTDPRSDATFTMTGSQLAIAVPAGAVHDAWSGGITAPRVMQAAPNTDFEVEARFDAAMTAGYQIQGILIAQDATNFLRFDVVRDGTNTRFFAASFANDVPTVRADVATTLVAPYYLRVKRVGSAWTGSSSSNGTTWTQGVSFTQSLTVTSVGPWVGNAGSPAPTFTGLVNYFFNTASPVAPARTIAGLQEAAEAREVPIVYGLSPNYPNPFNPSTVIRYALPRASSVRLEVYAVTGELVRTLVQEEQPAGSYEVTFNAQGLASGVYFTRIHAGDFVATRMMLLVR